MKVIAEIIPIRKKPTFLKTLLLRRSKVENRGKARQDSCHKSVKTKDLRHLWEKFRIWLTSKKEPWQVTSLPGHKKNKEV